MSIYVILSAAKDPTVLRAGENIMGSFAALRMTCFFCALILNIAIYVTKVRFLMIFQPQYYRSFRCLAERCPDSCCRDWEVEVDEETVEHYCTLPGPLGEDLRKALTRHEGTFLLENHHGRCPMLREDGLCRIQSELGEQALCCTCRDFPRLRHDYGSFTELSLELSCPEAARLILSAPAGDVPCPPDDRADMRLLLRSRRQALQLLEEWPIPEGLALLLLYGCHVHGVLNGDLAADFDPASALKTADTLARPGGEPALLSFFRNLEILTARWAARLDRPAPVPWEEGHRALARYFVRRYWLQAVSDGDLYSRVKLCIISCILIRLLGGDLTATAQLYSKEIENDLDNIDAILDGAYTSHALTDDLLLGMLLKITASS